FLTLAANFRRDAVRAEYCARAGGHFFELFDKDRAHFAQLVHDVFVMDDFFADIDWRAVQVESDLDHINGSDDAGAEAAGLQEVDLLVSMGVRGDGLEWHSRNCG